jgi:hypothetical protein
MQRRFATLRVISSLYKFAALLLALFSFLGFAFALYVAVARPADFYPTNVPNGYAFVLITGGIGLFLGVFLSLFIYGAGSLIDVLLAVEENTRMTARETRRMVLDARRRDQPPNPQTRPQSRPQPKTQPLPTPPRPDSQAIRSLPPRQGTRPMPPAQPTEPLPGFNMPNPPPAMRSNPEPDDDEPDFGQRR